MRDFKVSRSAALDVDIAEWLYRQAEQRDTSFSATLNRKLRELYDRENEENGKKVKSQ